MTQTEFDTLVNELRKQHPLWFDGEAEPPVSTQELAELEAKIGCILPDEYKYFVSRYGCGNFAFTNILSVRGGDQSIFKARSYVPASFLPFSENGCGDYYGFLIESGLCGSSIYFADHEENYKIFDTEYENLFDYIRELGLKP